LTGVLILFLPVIGMVASDWPNDCLSHYMKGWYMQLSSSSWGRFTVVVMQWCNGTNRI